MDKDKEVKKRKVSRKSRVKELQSDGEAYAATNPSSYKLSQIVNISYGGLVFKYIDKEEQSTDAQEKSIFLNSHGYYFGDPPVDGELPAFTETPAVTIEEVDMSQLSTEHIKKLRQMRLEFAELTFRQIFALDKFIRENMHQRRFSAMHVTVG